MQNFHEKNQEHSQPQRTSTGRKAKSALASCFGAWLVPALLCVV